MSIRTGGKEFARLAVRCPGVFPDLTEAALTASNTYRSETLQSGPTLGLLEMRGRIVRHVMGNGAKDITPDKVLEVNGAMNGLGLIGRLFPGSKFYAGAGPKGLGAPANNVRLSFSHAEPEEIEEGVRRPARAYLSM